MAKMSFPRTLALFMKFQLRLLICLAAWAASESRAISGESPAPSTSARPAAVGRSVNPFIGTGGVFYLCGNETPAACVPFGAVRLGPDTESNFGNRAANTSGYFYRDERILGFSHTRLCGTGVTDGGRISS